MDSNIFDIKPVASPSTTKHAEVRAMIHTCQNNTVQKKEKTMKSVDSIGRISRKSGCNHILAKYFQGYLYLKHKNRILKDTWKNAQEINPQYFESHFDSLIMIENKCISWTTHFTHSHKHIIYAQMFSILTNQKQIPT